MPVVPPGLHLLAPVAVFQVPPSGGHEAVFKRAARLPPDGLLISAKLAEVLGAQPGDTLTIETQEGARPVREVTLTGLVTDYNGVSAFMDLNALHRLMREGDVMSGAHLRVDGGRWAEFYEAVKKTPRIAALTLREQGRRTFRETTGDMIGMIQRIYFTFATIIAFMNLIVDILYGVVDPRIRY